MKNLSSSQRKFWRSFLLVVGMAVLGTLASAGGQAPANASTGPPSEATVPVAVSGLFMFVAPQSGPLAELGESAKNGAELAMKTWGGGFNLVVVDEASGDKGPPPAQVTAVIGYLTESSLARNAPTYLFTKKPVLLPFLTNSQAAMLGPDSFFQLMPTDEEQGLFLATSILDMKRRPQRILVLSGPGGPEQALLKAFKDSLENPPQPLPPPPVKGKKPVKPKVIKPLDKNAEVVFLKINSVGDIGDLSNFSKKAPDLIVMAVDSNLALELAPWLISKKFEKVPVWGGIGVAFRDVGAGFVSLGLKLHVCLPVDLSNEASAKVADFNKRFLETYNQRPTWLSAMAYDALNLAITSASTAAGNPEELMGALKGQSHHSLGTYLIASGAEGTRPLRLMAVNRGSLAFLP